jgi:hypothetical protein
MNANCLGVILDREFVSGPQVQRATGTIIARRILQNSIPGGGHIFHIK